MTIDDVLTNHTDLKGVSVATMTSPSHLRSSAHHNGAATTTSLDLSDSSGVSSEHDSSDGSAGSGGGICGGGSGGTNHRFTRAQYRVLQVRNF